MINENGLSVWAVGFFSSFAFGVFLRMYKQMSFKLTRGWLSHQVNTQLRLFVAILFLLLKRYSALSFWLCDDERNLRRPHVKSTKRDIFGIYLVFLNVSPTLQTAFYYVEHLRFYLLKERNNANVIQTVRNDGLFFFLIKKKEKYSTLQLGAIFVSLNKGLSVNFPQCQSPTAQPEWKHSVITITEIN